MKYPQRRRTKFTRITTQYGDFGRDPGHKDTCILQYQFTRYGLIAIYKHPIQRGVEITQDVSCYRNRDKLRAGWPFGLYADLNLSSTEVWSPNCSINPPFEVSAAAKSQVEKRLDTGTKYLIAIAGTKYLRGYKVWKLEGHNRTSYLVTKKERAFQKSRKSATGWR